ncbi:MAG: hypothetical protein OHK0028_06220 [Deltaproteobacteria bacterium]
MTWIRTPETVRRFTIPQLVQHWISAAIWMILAGSAVAAGAGITAARVAHSWAGIAGASMLAVHAVLLAATGVRLDLPAEKIAFLPWGGDWKTLLRGRGSTDTAEKYAPAEKGDYLAILAWSLAAASSGILLRHPSFFGVPGPFAYDWIRTAHAGFGAALTVHLLVSHIPGRWILSPPDFRRSILTGLVPLREAVRRPGWIRDLEACGILVPEPVEPVTAEEKETETVRDLLELGNRHAREGAYRQASEAYAEALRLLPEYSQARFNLAVALLRDGRVAEAREQLLTFMEKDPFNPMADKARKMLDDTRGCGE